MWRDFARALRSLWQMSTPGGGAYRPDLHYMRGPGPKWHAKYGNLPPKTKPASVQPTAAVAELADHHA